MSREPSLGTSVAPARTINAADMPRSEHASARRALATGQVVGVVSTSLVTEFKDEEGGVWLSFPVKAVKEKVLECINCAPGGEYLAASEIKKSLREWDGKPLTIDHPTDPATGELIFAASDVDRVQVGYIERPRWQGGFLVVDAYLDVARAEATVEGRGIVGALRNGNTAVEVSVGYGADFKAVSGTHAGQRFFFAQTDIEPDHLALLPIGTPGACSVEDGCGAARAAAARRTAQAVQEEANMPQPKDNAVMALVRAILSLTGRGSDDAPQDDPSTPEGASDDAEVQNEDPIVANADGTTDEAADPPTSGDDNEPGQGGAPIHNQQESDMDRAKLIQTLAAADSVPFDEKDLTEFSDERLSGLATLAGVDCGCGKTPPVANAEGAANETPDEEPTAPQGVLLPAEVAAKLIQFADNIGDVQEMVANRRAEEQSEREGLVGQLKANARCAVSETDLRAMSLSALRGLAQSLRSVDYTGLGLPRGNAFGDADDDAGYMAVPSMFGNSNQPQS